MRITNNIYKLSLMNVPVGVEQILIWCGTRIWPCGKVEEVCHSPNYQKGQFQKGVYPTKNVTDLLVERNYNVNLGR